MLAPSERRSNAKFCDKRSFVNKNAQAGESRKLTLARLEAGIFLVDHVNTTPSAYNPVGAMTALEGLK